MVGQPLARPHGPQPRPVLLNRSRHPQAKIRPFKNTWYIDKNTGLLPTRKTSMLVREFFNFETLSLVVPVAIAGFVAAPMLYKGLVDAISPWRDLVEEDAPRPQWTAEERRQLLARRNEERQAAAREAWRRGDPNATAMIGRRRSDYEALGIPFPEQKPLL